MDIITIRIVITGLQKLFTENIQLLAEPFSIFYGSSFIKVCVRFCFGMG